MKLKALLLTLTASVTLGVFADAANVLLTFSTCKFDRYADGHVVADGEWYALVWTTNNCFGGVKEDGTAAVEGDLVVLKAPLAKGGCCPTTVFQIDSARARELAGGNYAFVLFDTRDCETGLPCPKGGALKVRDSALVTTFDIKLTVADTGTSYDCSDNDPITSSQWPCQPDWLYTVAADEDQPTFVHFNPFAEIDGKPCVGLVASNVNANLEYEIQMASSMDKVEEYRYMKFDNPAPDSTVSFHLERKNNYSFFGIRAYSVKMELPKVAIESAEPVVQTGVNE